MTQTLIGDVKLRRTFQHSLFQFSLRLQQPRMMAPEHFSHGDNDRRSNQKFSNADKLSDAEQLKRVRDRNKPELRSHESEHRAQDRRSNTAVHRGEGHRWKQCDEWSVVAQKKRIF